MNASNNRFKKLVYDYDLFSGKVNSVAYQAGQPDAFYHRYGYDAENRLTDVETSKDQILWERDARYSYYRHGPLARTIIGQNQVQGTDYAYTLQGWLKGINSTSVGDGNFDMGQDGKLGTPNSNIARDVYGFSLNYFNGDYKPIGNSVTPFATIGVSNDLFNGNIKSMVVNIPKLHVPAGFSLHSRMQRDETPTCNAMRILDTHPCNLNSFVIAWLKLRQNMRCSFQRRGFTERTLSFVA